MLWKSAILYHFKIFADFSYWIGALKILTVFQEFISYFDVQWTFPGDMWGSNQIWARSVQSFWCLLDTNGLLMFIGYKRTDKHANKQSKEYIKKNYPTAPPGEFILTLWGKNVNSTSKDKFLSSLLILLTRIKKFIPPNLVN